MELLFPLRKAFACQPFCRKLQHKARCSRTLTVLPSLAFIGNSKNSAPPLCVCVVHGFWAPKVSHWQRRKERQIFHCAQCVEKSLLKFEKLQMSWEKFVLLFWHRLNLFFFLGKLKYIWFLRQWENHMEIWITLTAPTEYLLQGSCNIKTNLNDDWRTSGKQIKHKFPIKLLFLGYVMRKQCSRETSALDVPTVSLIHETTW